MSHITLICLHAMWPFLVHRSLGAVRYRSLGLAGSSTQHDSQTYSDSHGHAIRLQAPPTALAPKVRSLIYGSEVLAVGHDIEDKSPAQPFLAKVSKVICRLSQQELHVFS